MDAKVLLFLMAFVYCSSADINSTGYKLLTHVYDQCDKSEDLIKCLKIQALKIVDRALHSKSFKIFDGVFIVRDETGRSFGNTSPLISDDKLSSLESNQIDDLLSDTTDKFLQSHQVKLDVPKLVEEGRGKMKKYIGPMIAAIAVKGGMMAMAMKGVAVMAGMALMMGKMALMMSSIMGIKKLVEGKGNGGEKTTVEIIKHPKISYGHSYSSSYEDAGGHGGGGGGGYGGNGGGGGYHRSLDSDNIMMVHERPYSAHDPSRRR